ncbi:PWI domain-containing protein [Polychaeton citri CBS 116435]|uniref:PWI domain-containing protein n=1 Tax=Polychaeton citri CBS 116435 TaxID=1314669 RepID=A0A9P4Q9S3_9PEZI|nr:PWI domain-containing protein [Polychaeton citri CBS 116435]
MSAALTTNVDQRSLRKTKFPPEFNRKVDMSKVNISVIKKWITDELEKLLQSDDDVVPELVFSMIEGTKSPNIKELQIALSGFLESDAPKFSQDLWKLLLSAQNNAQGIPQEMLEAKKMELIQKRARANSLIGLLGGINADFVCSLKKTELVKKP